MPNPDLARILREMAVYLEMAEVPFKPRAYERAAQTIEALEADAEALYRKDGLKALEEIPGVGKGIAERIEEYIKTKKIQDYEKLKKKFPIDVEDLSAVEGIGPKIMKLLWQKLRIKNLRGLWRAARAGKIRALPRFGEKSEQKILKGIEFLKRSGGRLLLGKALPLARAIEAELKKVKGVKEAIAAGSIRRMQETVGDLDFLVVSEDSKPVMDFFVSMPEASHVYAKGESKTLVRLTLGTGPELGRGVDADVRVIPKESFGAALQYFTGDKRHNIEIRKIAIEQKLKLNEYGVFRGKKRIAGETEKEVYEALGLEWIPPEIRTASGEIEAAQAGKIPKLIDYGDIKGDLQVQTNWADGAHTIEEYAEEAIELGYEYIAITDHTKALAMTRGLDEKRLAEQKKYIDGLNKKYATRGFRILSGAEVNIMKDGSLDIDDKTLAELDVVGAAVHSYFDLPRDEQTKRFVRVMQNTHVDIIFHPTSRRLQRRDPIDMDMDEIIRVAKETGTVLEIDANPERLDLHGEHIRKAVAAGVKLSIDTDAHSKPQMKFMEYGVAQARRGWATAKDVVNTMPVGDMLRLLK